jgi:hypothetical protein
MVASLRDENRCTRNGRPFPLTDAPSFGVNVITGFNAARSTLVVTTSRNVIAYGSAP